MKAYALIEQGWCQETYARDINGCPVDPNSSMAVAWCLAGVFMRLYADDYGDGYGDGESRGWLNLPRWTTVVKAIEDATGENMVFWNDRRERTQAEVVALLKGLNL